ncbi:Dysbindin-A [Nymphon striatum]|nr:Dysbindin-A [Nymphon striatum]
MFSHIKAKIQTVQQDLTDSISITKKSRSSLNNTTASFMLVALEYIKTLAFGEDRKKQYRPSRQRNCDFNAGSEILQEYQSLWKEIHENSEKNAKTADESDRIITDICSVVEKEWTQIKQLNYEVCMLPQLTNGIQELMTKIGDIEGLFEDVHSSLINLENMIDEGKMQEKKLDERFHLAMYKERKLAEFETFKFHLDCQLKAKVREQEIKQKDLLQERQDIFKEAFEEEMHNYRTKGQLRTTIASSSTHPSLDLADITLDEDQNVLNDFLADTTAESDVCSNDNDSTVEDIQA